MSTRDKREITPIKGFTRRTFLKGSAGAIASMLAARGGGYLATQGIFAPNLIRQNNEVVLAIQGFAHDAIRAVLPDFEKDTGLTVRLEDGPVSGDEMMTKYQPAFASGQSPVDVVSDADQSSPLFARAGWTLPLDEVIPQETWDDFPESMKSHIEVWHSFDGKPYRVPHEFAIGYFWTRKDWLDEKELKAPTTWDEIVSVGKEFTDPASGVWGTTDGFGIKGLLYVFVAYLAVQAGGSVFDLDEQTAVGLQFLYDLIHTHKVFPETALTDTYDKQNELYMADKIAFMRQWPYFLDVGRGDKDWYQPEKMVIELPPAGPAGSKSWWGGWGFSVPTFAPNLDGAKELIKYLTSVEIAPKLAEGQSWFIMPRASILNAFEGKDNPMVTAMGQYTEEGVPAPRPFHTRVGEAEIIVDDMAALFLTKQSSLADALKQAQDLIKALEE